MLAVKQCRAAYMAVPPLFSFLGGSGSGTASGACIWLFGGIMTLAGIGETEGDMVPYMASGGFWEAFYWMSSHTVGAMTFGARELKPLWRASGGKSHAEQSSVREVHPSNMQIASCTVANESPIGSFISTR